MRLPANAAFRPTPQGTIPPPGSRHRPTAGASGAGAEAGVGADADDAPPQVPPRSAERTKLLSGEGKSREGARFCTLPK